MTRRYLGKCHRNSRVHALQGIVRTWDRFTDRKRKGKLGNRLERRGSALHFAGASVNRNIGGNLGVTDKRL